MGLFAGDSGWVQSKTGPEFLGSADMGQARDLVARHLDHKN